MKLMLDNYYSDKYDLTPAHSDVVSAAKIIPPGKALDLGCGRGRNSLYLALKGFNVTAWDKNPESIKNLQQIIDAENIKSISTNIIDLDNLRFHGEYDFIFSTVVMMFLSRKTIPGLIANMKSCTKKGGYNLIVAAMDTEDYPCTVNFPFTFRKGELRDYYLDWDVVNYNEDVGELHKTDIHGNRIKLRFATMLAQRN